MKSFPALFLFSVMFIFLPFSALELIADKQVIEEDDFVSRPIEEIEELFRQREFDIVIDECKRLVAYDPWRWEAKWALMKLSEVYESIGDVGQAQAIRERLKAQTSHPRERAEIMLWQLRHMVEKHDYEKVDEIVDEIITKLVGDYHPIEALGIAIDTDLQRDRYESAQRRIDFLVENYPLHELAMHSPIRLSERYREQDKLDKSLAVLLWLQEVYPRRVDVLVHLADTYRRMGEFDLALEVCDQAVVLAPMHSAILHTMRIKGNIHRQQGDLQGAIEAFTTAAEFRGVDEARWAIRDAAECYRQLGKYKHAIEMLDRLVKDTYPDHFVVEAHMEIASLHDQNRDFEKAEFVLKQLAEKYSQTHQGQEAMMRLLELYWQMNQKEKAVDFLVYLVTANPNPEIQQQAFHRMMNFGEGIITEIEERGKLSELKLGLRRKVNQAKYPSEAVYSLRILAEIASRTEDWE
ncbi:MAG: tetratricopeptide repeat protein, partial [Candidatus Poribacteria bacterium]|nr:tetratricopeptide repeat protein [Candidatus Poribacteria bacterium]